MEAQPDPNSFKESHQKHALSKIPTHLSHQSEQLGEVRNIRADDALEELGYAPELVRNRSTAHLAFMSFVLASVPYGLATSMYYPLVNGGSVVIIWGWVLVSIIILCVAASLGEITSKYPTAGGVYYQTFMLAPVRWRLLASWICGWAYVAGNIIITLAVNFGSTQFIIACINVFEATPGVGIFEAETYQVFLIFAAVTIFCSAVSAFGNRFLPWLDTFAIFWTLAGLISISATCLALAKNGRHNASYVFGSFTPESGWTDGWAFMVGLLQAAYATSSTGMVLSMCEEVRDPALQVPRAMIGTIFLNTIAGLLLLVPLVFVLPSVNDLISLPSGQPVPTIIKSAVGSSGGAFGLLLPLIVLALLCEIGCTTATSRCIWAFARDGAIPGSEWWRRVHPRLNVPLNALLLSMAVQILLGAVYFGSPSAFNAFSGSGVIFLTVSYAGPIAVSVLGKRMDVVDAPFSLGRAGWLFNLVALGWTALAIPLFCMPSQIPVTITTMNYASAVFAGFVAISAFWYWLWGRSNFHGPPTSSSSSHATCD